MRTNLIEKNDQRLSYVKTDFSRPDWCTARYGLQIPQHCTINVRHQLEKTPTVQCVVAVPDTQ